MINNFLKVYWLGGWNELNENYFSKLDDNSEISKYIKEHNIGEFAVCIDEMEKDHFISFVACWLFRGMLYNLNIFVF